MQIENINPGVRIGLFVLIMAGIFYGGYYFLFHPIPVQPDTKETEEVIPSRTNTTAPQRYTSTTNKDKIKSYVSNVSNSVKKKDVKKNPANYIIIDKIGVSAPLEMVNFDSSGNMATPSGPSVVALYSQGAKVGSAGTVVVSGHRDTERGKAIFYRLSQLAVGDAIMITDSSGKGYKYIVDSKNNYPTDNFPSKEIFSNGDTARLNLVTCSGVYDRAAKKYTQRLVVSAVLSK